MTKLFALKLGGLVILATFLGGLPVNAQSIGSEARRLWHSNPSAREVKIRSHRLVRLRTHRHSPEVAARESERPLPKMEGPTRQAIPIPEPLGSKLFVPNKEVTPAPPQRNESEAESVPRDVGQNSPSESRLGNQIVPIRLSNDAESALRQQGNSRWLDRLTREACDRLAIRPFGDALKASGYLRESANQLIGFYDRCKGPQEVLDDAAEILLSLSDFIQAKKVAAELVVVDPITARNRYLRARAEEGLSEYRAALADYVDTMSLLGDPSKIAGSVFYDVARAYDKANLSCSAMAVVQQWVRYDEQNRDNPQTRTLIVEYAKKGSCKTVSPSQRFSIPVNGGTVIAKAIVNGVVGSFIIDTGATFVSVSPDFASKAGIPSDGRVIQQLTANGIGHGVLATANAVQIGPMKADQVAVLINAAPFGRNLDGLLGMSFLARFHVTLTPRALEISKAE